MKQIEMCNQTTTKTEYLVQEYACVIESKDLLNVYTFQPLRIDSD